MKLSKVFHVASAISGILGVIAFFGIWGGGMMSGVSGMMGYGQGQMMSGVSALFFLLIAIWLQLATIHHMMLEKKGEIV
jgi:hypothetical protein